MGKRLLQNWVMHLKGRKQSLILSALRGLDCDENATSNHKMLTKSVRTLSVNIYTESTNYGLTDFPELKEMMDIMDRVVYDVSIGNVSHHWFTHTVDALKVISMAYPDNDVREYWVEVLRKRGDKDED